LKNQVIIRNGQEIKLDKATTLRLCRDMWEHVPDCPPGHLLLTKINAIKELGFSDNEARNVRNFCFCCANVGSSRVCSRCILINTWGELHDNLVPCTDNSSSPYRRWVQHEPGMTKIIIDACNTELRRIHARLR